MNGRLDVSHGAWSGSYITFAAWKVALVRAALLQQPYMTTYFVSTNRNYHVEAAAMYFERDEVNISDPTSTDPLLVLLTHSPIDGTIAPEDCDRLSARLSELRPYLESEEMKLLTSQFVAGCRWAAHSQSPLVFE